MDARFGAMARNRLFGNADRQNLRRPPPTRRSSPNRLERVREFAIDPSQRPVLKSGSLNVSFQLGECKNDLTVFVDSAHTIALEGRIRTEDGLIPEDAKVTLDYFRGNEGIMGEYKTNGDFVVSGVENNGFILYVRYAYCKDESKTKTVYGNYWTKPSFSNRRKSAKYSKAPGAANP